MAKQKHFDKSFDNRKNDEKKEGYESVETGLPSARFQDTKQVLGPDELGLGDPSKMGGDKPITTASVSGSKEATKVKSKIKIKPDVAVTELEGKQVGGVPLAGALNLRSVAGVSSLSPADDTSKVPYSSGDYRPQSRYGKKRSEDLFELDNTISEQIVPEVDDALDLRDAPEAKQGYNGRKQFKQTRSKKNFAYTNGDGTNVGRHPQQLLNDVSVDFQTTSKRLYTTGQVVKPLTGDIDSQADYPTTRLNGAATDFTMHKSNYHPKKLVITTGNDHITGVSITEELLNARGTPLDRDQCNMNWQVDANNVAKAMIHLQTDLGRETTDKWSPLGYVIHDPYQYNMLMHDIEASTGAIMATAYRSAVSSMAFQRNITRKDGVNPQRNAIKMIMEGYKGVFANSSANTFGTSKFNESIFLQSEYDKGSVAGLIAMFDTTGKYRTKADILGLQRSLKLHLAQADNNINPLHCKPAYLDALNKAHMFSTVDGDYNPMLAVHTTRKIDIVNPLSLNAFLVGWLNPNDKAHWDAAELTNPLRDQETGTLANYAYEYRDIRNTYKTRVQHPIVEGLLKWLIKHEGAFVNTFGANKTVEIPFEFNFMAPNLLSFMLCSASQEVAWERNIIFRDVLFAGEQETYIWDDLKSLSELNPLYSSQLKIQSYSDDLQLGKLAPDTIVREMWNGQMQLTTTKNGSAQYFLPWYFNEESVKGTTAGGSYTQNEGFFDENKAFNMSIPSIREGVRHEYVDAIKSMSERDIRLSIDRYTNIPMFTKTSTETVTLGGSTITLWTKYEPEVGSSIINNYIKIATLRYDPNSDGRLVAVYDLTSGSNRDLLHQSLYLIPKELGFIDDEYDNFDVITSFSYGGSPAALTINTTTLNAETSLGAGNSAKAYNGSSPLFITSYRVDADSPTDGSVDRAAALTQVFYNCFSGVSLNSVNAAYVGKTGIVPCLSYNDGAASDISGVYNLGSNNESTHVIDKSIRSIANRIWTMLQRFFLPVNRFENCFTQSSANVDYDPLESAFYFGVCGMLASDFTQDVLERLDIYDQLGLDYTEDVFVKDSLLFRHD